MSLVAGGFFEIPIHLFSVCFSFPDPDRSQAVLTRQGYGCFWGQGSLKKMGRVEIRRISSWLNGVPWASTVVLEWSSCVFSLPRPELQAEWPASPAKPPLGKHGGEGAGPHTAYGAQPVRFTVVIQKKPISYYQTVLLYVLALWPV